MRTIQADMHCHTYYSDGSDSPDELVFNAKKAGLKAVCKTDHDVYLGFEEMEAAGRYYGVKVIAGIEISTSFQETDVHVLGYQIDYSRKDILGQAMKPYWKMRAERARKILSLYAAAKVMVATPEIIREKMKVVCPYIPLTTLMEYRSITCGIPYKQAEKELKRGGQFYVGYDKSLIISPLEAVNLILLLGGKAVLAHPGQFNKRTDNDPSKADQILRELLEQLVPAGLAGLECYYPTHTIDQINEFLALAKKFNLAVTGGTDYHGRFKSESGKLGSVGISYADFMKFLKA